MRYTEEVVYRFVELGERAGGEPLKSIAEDFGVSDRAISKIALGQRWRSIR